MIGTVVAKIILEKHKVASIILPMLERSQAREQTEANKISPLLSAHRSERPEANLVQRGRGPKDWG